MSKNKTRLIIVITAIVTIISTLFYAETEAAESNNTVTEETTTEETPVEEATQEDTTSTENTEGETTTTNEESDNLLTQEPEIYNGDLYVFDSNVTMDKLVDGNVFIFGNNITITGQCSGNMFVFGNNITFDKAYAQASIFVASGTDITFNAVSNSLYAATSGDLIIDHQFGVYSDIYVACNTLKYDGIVGRNAFLALNNIELGDNAIFYGDLTYTSSNTMNFDEGVVTGTINYNEKTEEESKGVLSAIGSLAYKILQYLIIVLVVFFISKLFIKSPISKEDSTLKHPLITLGVGILATILIPVISIGLMFTGVGTNAGLIILATYLLLFIISSIILPIVIARYICINKKARGIKELLFTVLIAIVMELLITIPYIGILIYLLYVIYGIGIIIYTPLLNKKAKSSANTDNVNTKSKKIEVNKSEEKIAENKTENVTKDESPTVDSKNSEVEKNTTENKEEKSEE